MNSEEEKPLGQVAREGREKMNMPIWELASLTGLTEDELERFERGDDIALHRLRYLQLMLFLNLSAEFVFRGWDQIGETNSGIRTMFGKIQKATEGEVRAEFLELLKVVKSLPFEKQVKVVEMVKILSDFRRQRDQYKQRED